MGARAPPAAPGAAGGGVGDPTGSADDPDVVDARDLGDGERASLLTSRRAELRPSASVSPCAGEAGATEEAVDGASGLEEEIPLPRVARIGPCTPEISCLSARCLRGALCPRAAHHLLSLLCTLRRIARLHSTLLKLPGRGDESERIFSTPIVSYLLASRAAGPTCSAHPRA